MRPRESDIDAVFDACQDAELQRWVPHPVPLQPRGRRVLRAQLRAARRVERAVRGLGSAARRRPPDRDRGGAQGRRGRFGLTRVLAGAGGARKRLHAGGAPEGHRVRPRSRRHGLHPAALGVDRRETKRAWRLAQALGFAFEPGVSHEVEFRGEKRTAVTGYRLPRLRRAVRRRGRLRSLTRRCPDRRRADTTGAVSARITAVIPAVSTAASGHVHADEDPREAGVGLDEADRDLDELDHEEDRREAADGLEPQPPAPRRRGPRSARTSRRPGSHGRAPGSRG